MKKVIALLLTVLMAFSSMAVLVYAEEGETPETVSTEVLPHINIRGFMCCPIYEDKTNPDSGKLWPPDSKQIASAVFGLLPGLFGYMFNRNNDKMMDSLVNNVNKIFNPLMCNSEGKPVIETSGAYQPRPTAEEIKNNPTIDYAYDWRVDPFESASDLNDFINYLCDDLGFGQVVIECHSNGGTILLTYLSVYGTEKVRSCCFSASAVYGAGFAAELIEGRMLINGEGLEEYLINILENNEKSNLISFLVKFASKLNLLNLVTRFLNKLLTDAHDVFFGKFAFPILGNWLNVWAMVPDDSVEDGISYCRDNFNFDVDNEYKYFFEEVNKYTDEVRSKREAILDNINENCNLYVFCFYDLPGIPIVADWNTMSDGVLNSKDTSFGAQFKDYIDTSRFDSGEYVSPDGKCDGSTAKFKDQTWYFKDCNHLYKSDFLNTMAKDLLYYDGQATVDTFEQYPQFFKYDMLKQMVVPA